MDFRNPLPGVCKNLVHLLFLLVGKVEALEHTLNAAPARISLVLSLSARRRALAIEVDS